jgi:hypothetical protein
MRRLRVFLGLLWSAGVAHAAAALYDSPTGGFAFTPPAGWEIKQEAGEPFPTLSGPVTDLRSPYVVIKALHDQKDLFDLGDATVKEMLKDLRYSLNIRDAFETSDQEFGLKFVLSVKMPDPLAANPASAVTIIYRQAYYFVQGPSGTIYAVLATVPDAGWKKSEPLLDEMMKSYHLRPVVVAPGAKGAPAVKGEPAATH